MRFVAIAISIISLFPSSLIARTWERGDECPNYINTTVPGGGRDRDPEPVDAEDDPRWEEPKDKPPRFDTMVSVHEALLSCPNITGMDLHITGIGCTQWPDRWNFPFELGGGDVYPPLKELRLEGYDYEEKPCGVANYGQYHSDGYWPWLGKIVGWFGEEYTLQDETCRMLEASARDKSNLDLWLDAMDWSKLESLALLGGLGGDSPEILKIAPRLSSLRKLDLTTGNISTASRFISLLPSNNTLTRFTRIGDPLLPLSPLLEQHGNSLRTLEIRAEESSEKASPAYNTTELAYLARMATNLRHLSINIHRNGTWPLETLDVIASLPWLQSADLWLDITSECGRQRLYDRFWAPIERERANSATCKGEKQFQAPLVTVDSCLEVFEYMRGTNRGLTNVTFWVGDWAPPVEDGPLYLDIWVTLGNEKVACSVEDKPGGELRCIANRDDYWSNDGDMYGTGW